MIMSKVWIILFCVWSMIMIAKLYIELIRPVLIKKTTTKELERNPKWLKSELTSQYYGLDDIDIVIVENQKFKTPMEVRVVKSSKKLEVLLPSYVVNTRDIELIAKLLLITKISTKISPQVGMLYVNKPSWWLSILNYMLDGGNINQSAVKWEEKDKKPIDF